MIIMSTYVSPMSEMENNHRGDHIKKNCFMFFLKSMKPLRMIGLMSIISYMTIILFTWISANMSGYVYFSAGEPVSIIKYPEWLLGLIGIIVAIDLLRKELDGIEL